MTGIMVEPVEKTARRAIWPVLIEIVVLNSLCGIHDEPDSIPRCEAGKPETDSVRPRSSEILPRGSVVSVRPAYRDSDAGTCSQTEYCKRSRRLKSCRADQGSSGSDRHSDSFSLYGC
jgi:hypothetical protein